MIAVRNQIAYCADGRVTKRGAEPKKLIVHRISFAADDGGKRQSGQKYFPDVVPIADELLTGQAVAERFADQRRVAEGKRHWADRPGSYTDGQMPYSLLQTRDGTFDQCLAVRETGPHAQRWNEEALSVAVAGDHRSRPPTAEQWFDLVHLCGMWLAAGVTLHGHTELPDSSSDPLKECPGSCLSMVRLRHEAGIVAREIQTVEVARKMLRADGMTF